MLGKGRGMLYKYEIACQQAGLSEEKTAEIRRMFNAQYQKLYREKVTRNRSNCEVWHMVDLYGRDGEKGTYEVADPSVNVEEDLIHQMDLEKLHEVLAELDPEDREFILEYFEGENKFLNRMVEKYGLTRNQVIGRKRRILNEYSGLRAPPIRNGIPTKRRMIPTSFLHAIRRNVLSVRK